MRALDERWTDRDRSRGSRGVFTTSVNVCVSEKVSGIERQEQKQEGAHNERERY